jgi:hypothetical protein
MTLGEEQEAFFEDLLRLGAKALKLGYKIRGGELQRTLEQQEIYVKTKRSKTLNSRHIDKCAIDLHFTKDGKLCYPQELGDFWESLNPKNKWGGNWKSFKDQPHFERSR